MTLLLISLTGYLFGCLHGSQLVGFMKKINLKESGVKNAGASNATIVLGWKYGVLVALIDIGKGMASVFLIRTLLTDSFTPDTLTALLFVNALFVIIGHIFPLQMRFNGGKGTASIVGILLVLDWKIALISISLLLIVTFATDYLVLGVLAMYASFFLLTIFFAYSTVPITAVGVVWLISSIKHIENFKRLKNKEETRLSSLISKKAS
ncbi:glycerol-3-phosphate acyltransferase [Jeotgalibacillus sp. S-D1]|uniref:glycerol-3-phosphate acyltransferase n=1 Tax=Jeotgalibacillus sp. S-D1 TaxID=2552189 RepID=UPI001059903A|nr:glycerol-3-phosphate acyltransferase [Jeotgalibacillus sp. S-D1]TDL34816.1 glycerol-3-phosphate acyltransferase [Jeotgalibacillus sp. S-D1]